ncbi:MAG: SCO family protein [Bacteroidetes Order II. Incertae sedis bacterium]|nr:SCO family protein [Bacteroidetes Order II. bacterium]
MKKLLLFCLLFIVGCKKEESLPPAKTITMKQGEGQSIFQLPGTWATQEGISTQLGSLKGKTTLLAMIYTSCTFACPRLLADMRRIEAKIPTSERSNMRFILISIDPERDTPQKLKQFAADNKLDLAYWTLMRGSQSDLEELSAVLGFRFQKISPIDFAHSNLLTVFNPQGEMVFQQEGIGTNPDEVVSVMQQTARKLR